jgi:cobyrinic acid a,c-diamide synthase
MGLTPYQEHYDTENAISLMEEIARKYIDIDRILKIAMETEPLNPPLPPFIKEGNRGITVRIGVIRDSAFQFYYPENIEELEKNGAEIIEINAIEEDCLPDIDALYIGGGFPETNAIRLAENVKFKDSVRKAAESGLPIYAECGGLMFLGQSIISNGRRHPMVGIFPITFEMKKKPQAHGYTIIEVEKENPFYPIGTKLHGHEFHYSAVPLFRTSEHIYFAFKMKRGHGINNKRDGICYKNVFATYTHIHALGAEEWVRGLINKAKEYEIKRQEV